MDTYHADVVGELCDELNVDLPEPPPCRGCEDRDVVIASIRSAISTCGLHGGVISDIKAILARHDEGKRT